jgi:N-acetylmuramoyl-L-alanine amidase
MQRQPWCPARRAGENLGFRKKDAAVLRRSADARVLAPPYPSGNRHRSAAGLISLDQQAARAERWGVGFLLALIGTVIAALFPPSSEGSGGEGVTIPLAPPSEIADGDLPRIYGTSNPGRPLVVLDPGHGGRDPGASSPHGGRREKDVTLAIAAAIRDALAASGRIRVALTREDDRYIPLRDRYEIARRLDAGLFISIHADAAPANDGARGATIYTLSEVASDGEAALLAEQQNRADRLGDAPLSEDAGVNRILIDLAQRQSMNVSADFAALLRREAEPFFPFRPDYHRFASLVVLKAPDIPSILFETGYLTNAVDAAYIQSPEGQKQIALGMRSAIETHFARQTVELAER